MQKSPTQLMLEAQRHLDIRDILLELLKNYQGQKNLMMRVGVELGVSDATVYRWCDELGIDIKEYRSPTDEIPTSTPKES